MSAPEIEEESSGDVESNDDIGSGDDVGSGVHERNRRTLNNDGEVSIGGGTPNDNLKTVVKKRVYCPYTNQADFMTKFKKRRLALERATSVFIANEGPFPTESFELEAGLLLLFSIIP